MLKKYQKGNVRCLVETGKIEHQWLFMDFCGLTYRETFIICAGSPMYSPCIEGPCLALCHPCCGQRLIDLWYRQVDRLCPVCGGSWGSPLLGGGRPRGHPAHLDVSRRWGPSYCGNLWIKFIEKIVEWCIPLNKHINVIKQRHSYVKIWWKYLFYLHTGNIKYGMLRTVWSKC